MRISAGSGRFLMLAMAIFVVAILSLPEAAHAHAEPAPDAQIGVHEIHANGSESSGIGHCHGEASCSSGLHIVFGIRVTLPDLPPLPAPDRAPTTFNDTNLGREPPVPIAFL